MDKLLFKAEVKKQLALRKWSYTDLSEHTTYTPRSVQQIMYDDSRLTDRAINEFSSALDIDVNSLEREADGKRSLHSE